MQRNGFPFRTVVLALFVVGTVYLLYLYNTTLGRLRDAELSAERYRREEETKVAQLQDVMKLKDELQEKCDNEKREFTNRLNSLNQQYKMLKSQYDEHEVENMRLEQQVRRMKEEAEQLDSQRNTEYQKLKAEKELELSSLRDQVADAGRQREQLQVQVSNLQSQVQSGQAQVENHQQLLRKQGTDLNTLKNQMEYDQQQLRNKDATIGALQYQLSNKNNVLGQQQQQQQQQQAGQNAAVNNNVVNDNNNNAVNNNVNTDLQQGQQQGQQQGLHFDPNALPVAGGQQQPDGADVAGMNVLQQQNAGDLNLGVQGGLNQGAQQGFNQQPPQPVEVNNDQHQMMPPHNDQPGGPDSPDSLVNANVDGRGGAQHVEVKDEDHQVMPPDFNARNNLDLDKDDAGVNEREQQHNEDPLELKQMAPPDLGGQAGEGQGVKDQLGQQQPPIVNRVRDRNAAEEEEEEEEEKEDDQYRDDKYEDDNNNNNNNGKNIGFNNPDRNNPDDPDPDFK